MQLTSCIPSSLVTPAAQPVTKRLQHIILHGLPFLLGGFLVQMLVELISLPLLFILNCLLFLFFTHHRLDSCISQLFSVLFLQSYLTLLLLLRLILLLLGLPIMHYVLFLSCGGRLFCCIFGLAEKSMRV